MRTLVLALIACPLAAHAQLGTDASVTYGSVGASAFDNDDLTNRLDAAGYGRLEPDGVGVGTARYQFRGRLAGGVEAHTTGSESAQVGGFETKLSGRYALVNIGYDLVGAPTLKAYPLIGAGYGDLTLRLAPLADAGFDDVLAGPERGASLSRRGFLLNAGVGTDLLVPLSRSATGTRGLALGLRTGYLFPVGGDAWRLFATSEATAAPEASLAGPYLRLLLGFGQSRR